MRRALLPLALVLCLAPDGRGAQGRIDITPDIYFSQVGISTSVISPDGKQVAYVETRWARGGDAREADLCVVQLPDGVKTRKKLTAVRPLLPGQLRWGGDGRNLYFIDRRDGKSVQVWRVSARGGEPEAVTRAAADVQAFTIAPDGTVFYKTDVEVEDADWRALKERHKGGIEYGHGATLVSEVWRLEEPGKRAERLVADRRYVRDLEASPDGKRLALITAPDDRILTFEGQSRVEVCDTATGKLTVVPEKAYREDAATRYGWLEYLAWSPDGKALAFNLIFDGHPSEVMVADLAEAQARVFKMSRPDSLSVKGYGGPIQWGSNEELYFLGEERAHVRLCCATGVRGERQGTRVVTPGDQALVVDHFSVAPGGQIALVLNDATRLPDLFTVVEGKPVAVTDLNPQVRTWKLPQIEIFTWKGARGETVEGVLELPPDYVKGQKEPVPLVVEIHGGPTSSSYYHLNLNIYGRATLPARGYAVLSPNYRGSTGYGDKFITDLLGRENDIDVEDILKGVDALVERGIADKDRLGVMGWSNGGYLTNCILTKTERFKAASSGAGIVDAVLEWGTGDEPAYVMALKKGYPWTDKGEAYRKASATYDLDKIKTPTLIHVGSADERCPPGHSRMLYRALKEYNKVPTELLVYKGEPHTLGKGSSRRAKMEWDIAWFDRYILNKKTP